MSHPAVEVVVAMLRRQRDELVRLSDAVREDRPEAVHDLRTTVRRARSVLAAARPVLDRTVTDGVRDRLAQLGAALEPARDAEVRAELAQSLLEDPAREHVADGGEQRIRARLLDAARAEYARDRRAVAAVLDQAAWAELLADLDDLVRRPPLGPTAYRGRRSVLRGILRRQARRAHRRLGRMEETDLDSVHEARKAVRRSRYLAEAIAQVAPQVAGDAIAEFGVAAKRLQDVLGDHRDAVLHARWIAAAALAAEGAGENPEAYRRLERIEQSRAVALEADRRPAVDEFERRRRELD